MQTYAASVAADKCTRRQLSSNLCSRYAVGRNPDICASPPRPRPAELHGGARKGHGHCPPQEQYVCAHGQPESDVSGCLSE
eukprot:scaffold167670_cov18-Tisochrysis_lutea.AAC.1